MLVKKTIEIDNNLLEAITKIAKNNGNSEDKVLNDLIEIGLEIIDDNEYDSDELVQEIDEIRSEIKAGKCFKGDIEDFAKEIGLWTCLLW